MNVSILTELATIKDFVKECKKDKELVGFNVMLSKHKGMSYVLGKVESSLKAKYVLKVSLDWFNPIEQQLIANAINEGLHGKSLTPEQSEAFMVSLTH